MKFTLSWLKEHLDTKASLQEISDKLTAIGLEVESIEDRAEILKPFVVGYVEKADKHPDADRLKVCTVDIGGKKVEVVCGAPNARQGMKGVFAAVGTIIPLTGDELKKGKIRGVESHGMLCSAKEMGIAEESDGIIELPDDAPVGKPFASVLGLDDAVIEVGLTPNRGDCAGVRGIARDLAAAGLGTLKPLQADAIKGSYKSPISVEIAGKDSGCQYFIGRHIKNVKSGPSPAWLQGYLTAIGLRPISALVDITNYMTVAFARPFHVYDADKISGQKIIARISKANEKLSALNGKDYVLESGLPAIADNAGVLGLGGIIGGVPSGCTTTTTNVFLECALFEPGRISDAGRKLQINSDARYRFERGVDAAFMPDAVEIATRMIVEFCGGEVSEIVSAGSVPEDNRKISYRPDQVLKLCGVNVPVKEQLDILQKLGCDVKTDKDIYNVRPPSWRPDLQIEQDIVEEVLRIHGFDKIPATSVPRLHSVTEPVLTVSQQKCHLVRRALAGRGLNEAVTYSFLSKKAAVQFGHKNKELELVNPISADLDVMRPSILPNLIAAAGQNANRGFADVSLFEIGPAYRTTEVDGQDMVAAGIRSGTTPLDWKNKAEDVSVFDAKADLFTALENAGLPPAQLPISRDAPSYYHPGRSGVVRLGSTVIAHFGEINPGVLINLDVKGPVVGFELFLDRLPEGKKKSAAKPLVKLSPFQPLRRDFAFLVDEKIDVAEILKAARSADKSLITDATIFDVYQGKGVDPGKKSIAVAVMLQPITQTLTDEEIETICQKIIAAVTKQTGATLRG